MEFLDEIEGEDLGPGPVESAALSGDRRAMLLALKRRVARQIDTCDSGRDIAALSKRMMEIAEELDALPDPEAKASPLEAARRRVAARGGDG